MATKTKKHSSTKDLTSTEDDSQDIIEYFATPSNDIPVYVPHVVPELHDDDYPTIEQFRSHQTGQRSDVRKMKEEHPGPLMSASHFNHPGWSSTRQRQPQDVTSRRHRSMKEGERKPMIIPSKSSVIKVFHDGSDSFYDQGRRSTKDSSRVHSKDSSKRTSAPPSGKSSMPVLVRGKKVSRDMHEDTIPQNVLNALLLTSSDSDQEKPEEEDSPPTQEEEKDEPAKPPSTRPSSPPPPGNPSPPPSSKARSRSNSVQSSSHSLGRRASIEQFLQALLFPLVPRYPRSLAEIRQLRVRDVPTLGRVLWLCCFYSCMFYLTVKTYATLTGRDVHF